MEDHKYLLLLFLFLTLSRILTAQDNMVKSDGYYIGSAGIYEKNFFSPDKETLLGLRFMNPIDADNPVFHVAFIGIDKGEDINKEIIYELGLKSVQQNISGTGKIKSNNGQINIHLEFIRELKDFFALYIIDGQVSNDGLSMDTEIKTYTRLTKEPPSGGGNGKFISSKSVKFNYYPE
jgi:hypothetical protein